MRKRLGSEGSGCKFFGGLGFLGVCRVFWLLGLGFGVWRSGFGVYCLKFRVEGFMLMFQGLGPG